MKLTDETIKRIRHNKYSVDCIQGMCTLSDGDIIANLCDTIEALRQDNADWQKRYEELDTGHSKLYKEFCELRQREDEAISALDEISQLRVENERLQALADVDPETLSVLIRQYVNENDDKLSPDAQQLKQQLIDAMRDYRNPADVAALKRAREALIKAKVYDQFTNSEAVKDIDEAIRTIDKIGGREDV